MHGSAPEGSQVFQAIGTSTQTSLVRECRTSTLRFSFSFLESPRAPCGEPLPPSISFAVPRSRQPCQRKLYGQNHRSSQWHRNRRAAAFGLISVSAADESAVDCFCGRRKVCRNEVLPRFRYCQFFQLRASFHDRAAIPVILSGFRVPRSLVGDSSSSRFPGVFGVPEEALLAKLSIRGLLAE